MITRVFLFLIVIAIGHSQINEIIGKVYPIKSDTITLNMKHRMIRLSDTVILNNDTLKLRESTVFLNDYPIIHQMDGVETLQCFEPEDKSHIIITKHAVDNSRSVRQSNKRVVNYTKTILKYPYRPKHQI